MYTGRRSRSEDGFKRIFYEVEDQSCSGELQGQLVEQEVSVANVTEATPAEQAVQAVQMGGEDTTKV